MSNSYFTKSGWPSNNARAVSATMRAEIAAIEAGFDLLPVLSGNGSKIIAVNSGATALEAITTTGTGSGVRATSPTLEAPVLGVATATSINKVALTAPATSATITVADGETLYFDEGTYAPTVSSSGTTSGALASTPSFLSAYWVRTGAQVEVFGVFSVQVSPSVTANYSFEIDLPVAHSSALNVPASDIWASGGGFGNAEYPINAVRVAGISLTERVKFMGSSPYAVGTPDRVAFHFKYRLF